MTPELSPLALLYALATGHPDAAVLKQYADSARVPPMVVWAVARVESGTAPNNLARGRHGEIGRMQLRAAWSKSFAAVCGTRPLTDYRTNICKGAFLLRWHYDHTGSWSTAIQRFNGSGPATVVYLTKVECEIGRMVLRLAQPESVP